MRSLALALAAAMLAAPLAAQIAGRRDYGPAPAVRPSLPDSRLPGASPRRQVEQQRDRIERARNAGLLSRREARRLDREARLIRALARRYARDGLSRPEREELDSRTRALEGAIAAARASR